MSVEKKKNRKAESTTSRKTKPVVMICMGSDSDWPIMKEAAEALEEFNVPYEARVLSAHRTPLEMVEFAKQADKLGFRVIVAGAGGAAHLPGMIASLSPLPVIGVPIPHGVLAGQDALMSIVQMPKGVPVATVAIGSAFNAGLLAVQILASGKDGADLLSAMRSYKNKLRAKVMAKAKLKV